MEGVAFRCFVAMAIVALIFSHRVAADITCDEAVSKMIPCESFLFSGESAPSDACCDSVRSLDSDAKTSPGNRRAICRCFKETAKSFPINLVKVQKLPQMCHVNLDVAIDPNINCDTL